MQLGDAIFAGLIVWPAATLLIEAWIRRRRRPDLAERLMPFQFSSLADEGEEWLRQR